MPHVPERLHQDAIIEAVLEIRFESSEIIPEITVGRLADRPEWKYFRRNRLPISELPAQIRLADPNLRVQPIIELVAQDGITSIKIGTNVLSFHNTKKYLGWTQAFKEQLDSTIIFLFQKVQDIKIRRIGLRYINALTNKHHISSAYDLDICISLKTHALNRPFNLNFMTNTNNFVTMTRIATKELTQGAVPEDLSAYVDIDTYTPDGFASQSEEEVMRLVDEAHTCLKSAFFQLLPDNVITQLEDRA